jgi:hypothetical protein
MENQVIEDVQNVPANGPVQQDVALNQDPAQVTNITNNNNSITDKPAVPIGEADHSTEIAANTLQSDTTYSYNSQRQKVYDESVETTTVESNGSKPLSTEWNSQMTMDNKYKVDDSEDYRWNKLAKEQAQNIYSQEENQARYESIQAKQEYDKMATSAFNDYFSAKYASKQTQDKMGWTGGQEKASDLQISFLQAQSAANMYTQKELQKYGLETKLETARLYADAEQRTLALQYYNDARSQAQAEAELTGFYIEPEAGEMMVQISAANDILNNPNSSESEIERANSVIANGEAYFKDLKFETSTSRDKNGKVVTEYRGVKTLANLQFEETKRNNKVNEELQRQSNEIAKSAAGAAWASARTAKRQLNADITLNKQNFGKEVKGGVKQDMSKYSGYPKDTKYIYKYNNSIWAVNASNIPTEQKDWK